jgi:dienelactone hydrolase
LLTYINESETAVVVLHEIYGINKHITDICRELSGEHFDVFAPNMLQREKVFDHDQENDAYNNFINCIGFEEALNQVTSFLQDIRNRYQRIIVIGFSVGATIAWLCSNEPDLCDGVIGFYGSRIRGFLDIEPKCPILLFVPTKEESFNIYDFIEAIKIKNNVCIQQLNGLHGFTNPSSPNYSKQSSDQAYKEMIVFLKSV